MGRYWFYLLFLFITLPFAQKEINSQGLFNIPIMDILFCIIIFFILLYYAVKLFLRYMLPWLLQRYVKKQQGKYGQFTGQKEDFSTREKEGEVRIKKKPPEKSKNDTGFGEYVDFEDVDDHDEQKK